MKNNSKEINFFGITTFRNENRKFGIKTDDRRRHVYIIGKTGMGKTELLKNMAIQDIQNGKGVGFVDPHGEAAEELLEFVPKDRVKDVIYFNPADIDWPIAFNVMEQVDVSHRHLVASGLMGVFKKIWPDVWSARMEYILNNSILALLEYPDSTLLGINRILADAEYREKVIARVTDPVIKSFWVNEFAKYNQRYEVEATAAIQNKIGQFISAPLIRNIIGQTTSTVDMRQAMDEGKILILNLSKGRIGEDASKLLGGLLITKLQLAAMSRVDIPEKKRRDFFLYVDEFQNFATESFCSILSEARKYRLSLILAHQYIAQMEEPVRDAVFGNVGTLISFRVGAEDAEFLEKEFYPEFSAQDLVNLPKYNIYLKLMVDGVTSKAFSARTLPPIKPPKENYKEEIIKLSREKYATPKRVVEEKIAKWTGDFVLEPIQAEELYDAECQRCGKKIKVPFKPDPQRPVYCKSCLKKIEREKKEEKEKKASSSENEEQKQSGKEGDVKTVSLEDLLAKRPVFFRPKKEEEHKSKKIEENIDKEKLKQEIKRALEEEETEGRGEENKGDSEGIVNGKAKKSGKIEPGQVIKF